MKNKKKPKGKSRPKLTTLMKTLDLSNINLSVEKKKRGRPPRNQNAMLKAFIVMIFRNFSERDLSKFLHNYPFWSRLCGFRGKAPCHATFSNFKRRIGEDELKSVMKKLVEQLIDAGALKLEKVVIDSSELDADLRDTEARWGHGQEEYFYGYKIHIACCADAELPVHISVTTGNVHDSKRCLCMVKGARSYRTKLEYMIGDGLYDTINIHETLMEKYNIVSVTPYNPRKGEKIHDFGIQRLYHFKTTFLKQIYRRRTSVERVNNLLKRELGLEKLRYKGLKAVTFHAYITCIALLSAALTAVLIDSAECMRRVSFFN